MNVLVESADLARDGFAGDRGFHRSAICVSEHQDGLGPEHGGSVFQAGNCIRSGYISSDADDEEMADALVEYELDGHTRISARQHRSEGLLLLLRVGFQNVEVFRKRDQVLRHEALIPLHQQVERLVGCAGFLDRFPSCL